jgi:hypothetical protein
MSSQLPISERLSALHPGNVACLQPEIGGDVRREDKQRADVQDVDRSGQGEHGEQNALLGPREFVEGALVNGIGDGDFVIWRGRHRSGLGDRMWHGIVVMAHGL